MLNVNLKKYPRQIQHPVLKMERLKIVNNFNCKLFLQRTMVDVSHVLSWPLFKNKSSIFYKREKDYITVEKLKTPEQDVKCV